MPINSSSYLDTDFTEAISENDVSREPSQSLPRNPEKWMEGAWAVYRGIFDDNFRDSGPMVTIIPTDRPHEAQWIVAVRPLTNSASMQHSPPTGRALLSLKTGVSGTNPRRIRTIARSSA